MSTAEDPAAVEAVLAALEARLGGLGPALVVSLAEQLEASSLARQIDILCRAPGEEDGAEANAEGAECQETAPRDPTAIRRCQVEGCEEPARARGLCSRHYQRQRYSEKRAAEEQAGGSGARPKRGGGPCSVDGCSQVVYARGMCGKHFMEWVRAKKKS